MNLAELYSLTCSSKIGKPFIVEKYFPLTCNKYITLQPYSKDSKTYDYWQEVLAIIFPVLKENDIEIVQIGGQNEKPLEGCYCVCGQTNLGQSAYIIKNSLMHVGADSFGAHFAGHYNKPIVALYSNNHINCVSPFWGDIKNRRLMEPVRKNFKPSFCFQEVPKTINTIKPEEIARNILDLLGFEYDYPYSTIQFGEFYTHPRLIEIVPDTPVNVANLGVNNIIVRMDFLFNENVLANQLSICPCSIVTNKPINLNLLNSFKPRIKQLIYRIEKDNNPKFAIDCVRNGLNPSFISYLSEEELNPFKLDYLEAGLIVRKDVPTAESLGLDIGKTYYRSNKFTLSNQKIYASKADWFFDKSIPNFAPDFLPASNHPFFFEELEYMYLTKI